MSQPQADEGEESGSMRMVFGDDQTMVWFLVILWSILRRLRHRFQAWGSLSLFVDNRRKIDYLRCGIKPRWWSQRLGSNNSTRRQTTHCGKSRYTTRSTHLRKFPSSNMPQTLIDKQNNANQKAINGYSTLPPNDILGMSAKRLEQVIFTLGLRRFVLEDNFPLKYWNVELFDLHVVEGTSLEPHRVLWRTFSWTWWPLLPPHALSSSYSNL